MSEFILTIGDKNLSSWSLRPWLLMKQAGIAFVEEMIRLDRPETSAILSEQSPSGFVPYLTHGELKIWDSLAIAEYLSDLFPKKQLWPADVTARAFARAISAEMHSGFSALRMEWPMNFTSEGLRHPIVDAQRDIARIDAIWTECRTHFSKGGGFLFGGFSIADAMYAPVVSRFVTYGPVALSDEAAAYMDTVRSLPAYGEWGEGARAETAASPR